MALLSLIFGGAVGLALGLTGGGGSILAVPLLVYGLAMAPREAVAVSLAAVGATAMIGALHRLLRREIDVTAGLLFAALGASGAPLGALIGDRIPQQLLLLLFAGLMLAVAARMWRHAERPPPPLRPSPGRARRAATLAVLGLVTGILAGLFGVGGGFVIVPALVLATGMHIRRAVATSLLAIALISAAGLASLLWVGRPMDFVVAALFAAGGVAGMFAGTAAAKRMSAPRLQKLFAALIVVVGAFVAVRSVLGL